jgi:hypothetical protein
MKDRGITALIKSFIASYENICRTALIVLCALAAAAVPAYWALAKTPEFVALEKRYRAQWPAVTGGSFGSGEWGERVDAWMADKMPLREFLVGVDSYLWYFSGRQTARDVFISRSGGLVEAPFDYLEGELTKRMGKIASFANEFGNRGTGGLPRKAIAHVVMTPLDAGYVSPLPERLTSLYNDDEIADRIVAFFGEPDRDGAAVSYMDLRSVFVKPSGGDLYYRTDHHWNGGGAYAAYCALGGALGYSPLPESSFDIDRREGFYGSVYAKSGLWLTKPDAIELWSPPCPVRATAYDAGKAPDVRDSPFFMEYLDDWDKYSVFLGGIRGLSVIENLGISKTGRSLLIIKDSYANSLIPLLIAHYDTIVAVDLRRYREPISGLYEEYFEDAADVGVLYVYSMNHIVNDSDLLWLR